MPKCWNQKAAETLEVNEAVLPSRKIIKNSKDYFGFGESKSYQRQAAKDLYCPVYFDTWNNAIWFSRILICIIKLYKKL